MTDWIRPKHTKGEIDRAGKRLLPWWRDEATFEGLLQSYRVVENWRTAHAMPLLTFRISLGSRARRVDPKSIVAQRMKRFTSLMNKLARQPTMKLSQMQDLGGCRAIVADVPSVYRLFDLYGGEGAQLSSSEGGLTCDDYIVHPKPDGYRGIHVVGRYKAQIQSNEPWNGQRIEIQLRSQLQHAFATAVETVTTFTREPLKFGAGPTEWRRFFSLMGSALAIREGTALVPGTPTNPSELTDELRELTKSLKVRARLRGWADTLKALPSINTAKEGWSWLLLVLDVEAGTIKVTGFDNRQKAAEAIAEIEKPSNAEKLDAVLVWVRSIRDLRKAYPNYYGDTFEFLKALDSSLRSRS